MTAKRSSEHHHAWWVVVAIAIAGMWTFSACGSNEGGVSGSSSGASSSGASSSGATSSSGTTSSGGSDPDDPGSSGGPTSGDPDASSSGEVPGATPPNLKVAFIGDTAAGKDFKAVLALVKREKAELVLVQGDVEYGGDKASDWLPVIDGELDTATTKIPYFVSRGNHDDDWDAKNGLGPALKTRLAKWQIPTEHADPTAGNYSVVYKGLKMVFVDESETSPTRADYVKQRLENDKQIWKICSWHKNMRDSNVGPKGNEMGWQIYENSRAAGAIVAQGHSHTYSRSKTLTNDAALTVDATCSDPFALCVGPGKHFFFDSSLGGVGLRALENTNKAHWATTYAADFGALFIEFHVDGDPRKAKGYFKNVGDVVIDPPAKSGKTFFTITASP